MSLQGFKGVWIMSEQDRSDAAAAERIARRRTRVVWASAIFYLLWQIAFYQWGQADAAPARSVDQVKVGAWVVWTLVLLLIVGTGGAFFKGRAVRGLINDELSVANRHAGQRWGFWAAVLAGLLVYGYTFYEGVGAREAVHFILSAGVGVALVSYAALERRAERAA